MFHRGSARVRTWALWKGYLAKAGCAVPEHGSIVSTVPDPSTPCSGGIVVKDEG